MEKRRDELELLFLKNKQSNKNTNPLPIIVDIIGLIACFLTLSFVAPYDNRDAVGFKILILTDIVICLIYGLIPRLRNCKYFVLLGILLFINFLLLCNVEGWNEGSMAGSYYYIDFFKPASDILWSLLLISAFLFSIPIALYVSLLHFLSRTTYCLLNRDKFKTKNQENTKER